MQPGLFSSFSTSSNHQGWFEGHHDLVVWASRIVVFAALCLTACSSEELALSQPPTVNNARAFTLTQVEESSIPFRFVDSQSGQVITEQLKVKFTGVARVRNIQGQVVNERELTVSSGVLTVMPDFTTGDTFSLLVGNRQLGYVETGLIVGGGSKFGELTTFDVPLIKLTEASIASVNSQDLGIAVAKRELIAASDGSIPAVSVVTPNKNISGSFAVVEGEPNPRMAMGEARIDIEPGTRALDSNGRPILISGALTVSAVHYSGQDQDALVRFPGGFVTPVSGVLPQGSAPSGQGMFITGGFATFNLTDSQGRALKNFDRALQMRIDTPKMTVNPLTGKSYKSGDFFPVYAFDETTGLWSFETQGQVLEKSPPHPGLLEVRYSSRHLTSWNLDNYPSTDCPVTVNLPFNRDVVTLRAFGTAAWPFFIPDGILRESSQPGNTSQVRIKLPRLNSTNYTFFNVDNDAVSSAMTVNQLRVDVRHKASNGLVGTFYHNNTCSVTIDPTLPALRSYSFTVAEHCVAAPRINESTDVHVTAYGTLTSSAGEQVLVEAKGTSWTRGADMRSMVLRSDLPEGTKVSRLLLREYLPGAPGADGYRVLKEVNISAAEQGNSSFSTSFSLVGGCPGVGEPPPVGPPPAPPPPAPPAPPPVMSQ